MNKEGVLERNKKNNIDNEDEMKQYINGKAGLSAKLALLICIALDKKFEDMFYFE